MADLSQVKPPIPVNPGSLSALKWPTYVPARPYLRPRSCAISKCCLRIHEDSENQSSPELPALCFSAVPVKLGDGWLDKSTLDKTLGTPKAMTIEAIDEAVANWISGAKVAKKLISPVSSFMEHMGFCSHSSCLRIQIEGQTITVARLVRDIGDICLLPFCLSVKANLADYVAEGDPTQTVALGQVRWLVERGMIDFMKISSGNAEQTTSGRHNSFSKKTTGVALYKRKSTKIRAAYYTTFTERVYSLQSLKESKVPLQSPGGF